MLGQGWLTLRQAQEALRAGRLEDAQRLLNLPAVQGIRGQASLLARLAQGLVARAERRLGNDDPEASWRDLLQAERLQSVPASADRLRQALTRLGLAEIRGQIEAGEPARAAEAIARLRARNVHVPELQALQESVQDWLDARDQADRGSFGSAIQMIDRLGNLHQEVGALQRYREDLQRRQREMFELLPRLHAAMEENRWRDVVTMSEQVLLTAPLHDDARRARRKAWKAIEPATLVLGDPSLETAKTMTSASDATLRCLLWIDGVGGYLVCLGSRLMFGQATAGERVDIPLIADVSRLHASLTRDSEGYVLEAVRPVQVNAQPITRALLRPDDRVTLGGSCQFVFRQPAPLSATARLDLVSGHRVPMGVDGVLLMAETLVLGDAPQVHVTVPELSAPIVFYRHQGGLGMRHQSGLRINGELAPERGPLPIPAQVAGDEVSFALERV